MMPGSLLDIQLARCLFPRGRGNRRVGSEAARDDGRCCCPDGGEGVDERAWYCLIARGTGEAVEFLVGCCSMPIKSKVSKRQENTTFPFKKSRLQKEKGRDVEEL